MAVSGFCNNIWWKVYINKKISVGYIFLKYVYNLINHINVDEMLVFQFRTSSHQSNVSHISNLKRIKRNICNGNWNINCNCLSPRSVENLIWIIIFLVTTHTNFCVRIISLESGPCFFYYLFLSGSGSHCRGWSVNLALRMVWGYHCWEMVWASSLCGLP